MYLKTIKSKGNLYVYLCAYNPEDREKRFHYSFGRIDKAMRDMYSWLRDFKQFPVSLSELGCVREDIKLWLKKLKIINEKNKKYKSII